MKNNTGRSSLCPLSVGVLACLTVACGGRVPEVVAAGPAVPPPAPGPVPEVSFESVMFDLSRTAQASIDLVNLEQAVATRPEDPEPQAVGLDDRLELAKDAIRVMDQAAANVNRTLGFGAIGGNFGMAANPWADQDFRNAWDRLESWGTGAALITGALIAWNESDPVQGEEDTRIPILVGSVGMAGLAKLAGAFLGSQSGEKFEAKAMFVEHTRRAYEDLRVTYNLTEAAFAQNELFMERLADIAGLARSATTAKEKAEVVNRTIAELSTFDAMFLQIPGIYAAWESLLRKYCPPVPPNAVALNCPEYFPSEVTRHYELAQARLGTLRDIATKADEPLKLTPAIRLGLLGLKVPS